jgi:DNA-binding transcriptional MerR regulator
VEVEKGLYPIRAVSRMTRLTVDTLRAWERRYGAVTPMRKNGVRLYTKADVERLSMLREALNHGHSIGHVAVLSNAELKKIVAAAPASAGPAFLASGSAKGPIESIVAAVENFNYGMADRELSRMACVLGPRDVVYQVALPLMQLAGQRWHDQRLHVAHEHMLTQLLGNLLGGLFRLYTPSSPAATLLTATLAGDLHGFGILAAAMLAASAGLGVIHLGPNLPLEEVSYAAKRSRANAVLVSVTAPEEFAGYASQLAALRTRLPADTELWVAVNPPELASAVKGRRKGIHWIRDFPELERELKRIGGTSS